MLFKFRSVQQVSRLFIIGIIILVLSAGTAFAAYKVFLGNNSEKKFGALIMKNKVYEIRELEDGTYSLNQYRTGAELHFKPQITVLFSAGSPSKSTGKVTDFNMSVLSWNGNTDFTMAPGIHTVHNAVSSHNEKNTIDWEFNPGDGYTISARLELGKGKEEPVISYTITPLVVRYYTAAFTGLESKEFHDVDWVYQPEIWQGKRIPDKSYLIDESRCGLPVVMYGRKDTTVCIIADPSEMPYRLPTLNNSRFGVLLRDADGKVTPSIYAPIYGGEGSLMKEPFTFKVCIMMNKGSSYESFKYIAQNIYKFRDYRENTLTNLNETLDNIVDFIMDTSGENYSYWVEEYKTNEYKQDKPGYGRQQSLTGPYSLALVRDDVDIYEKRALPTIEYFVSRKSNMTKLYGYDPEYPMGGPLSTPEWAILDMMTGGRSFIFHDFFKEPSKNVIDIDKTYTRTEALNNAKVYLRPLLWQYLESGDEDYLEGAKKITDDYIYWRIDREPVDFYDTKSSFWNEVSPMFDVLEEIYCVTGEQKYKDAFVESMRQFSNFMMFSPMFPDSDITLNDDTVPSWRVSEIGLLSECGGTSHSHRGIFMPYPAPFFNRAAEYSDDTFLRDIGKANIIGRYANYPGYTLRNNYSTLFEKPDYPLKWKYSNTSHPNHPLPMATMILDYIVTDVNTRSHDAISFPFHYTASGAYFRNRLYGDRPGTFYNQPEVWLWLPKGLLKMDNNQLNYIAGYGNGKLYLALTNQSKKDVTVNIELNSDLVPFSNTNIASVWEENKVKGNVQIVKGIVKINVKADGITALAIDDIAINTNFQQKANNRGIEKLNKNCFNETQEPFGKMAGMIISPSPALTSVYVYTDATPDAEKSMVLNYRIDEGEWKIIKDNNYPFEFTISVGENVSKFEYYIEGSSGLKSSKQFVSIK